MANISPIRKIFNEMKFLNDLRIMNDEPTIVDFTLGQPHLPINPIVLNELSCFLASPNCSWQFGYSPVPGRTKTLKAISDLMSYYFPSLKCDLGNVLCTNGANQGLWNAFNSILKPTDAAVVFAPYFGQYAIQLNKVGAKLITVDTVPNNFRPDIASFENLLLSHPNIKCLILNNPVNPSGVVWQKDELIKLAACLRKHKEIIIIQDEVYRDLSYSNFYSLLDVAPDLFPRVITIFSCAKALAGAPDLRVGMVFASEHFINQFTHQQMVVTAEVSLLSQVALVAVLNAKINETNDYMAWEQSGKRAYIKNIDELCGAFSSGPITIQNKPEAGFYVLLNCGILINKALPKHIIKQQNTFLSSCPVIQNDIDIIKLLMNGYDVACLPGSAFGIDTRQGIIRVSCATEFDNILFFINQIHLLLSDMNFGKDYYD